MMAKMFYTLEEAKVALGKSDDEIKQLTRDGRLREFRDGPRLMFKADQVENLKGELGGDGDVIDLGPSDTGAPIGLVDSRSGSSPVISLADSEQGLSASPPNLKEDTALAADLGLSGSIGLSNSVGGMPSPVRPGTGSGSGLSGLSGKTGSSSGSRGGINLLGDDGDGDPSAQTAINPAMNDNLDAQGMGSGSGLLDLTRESDNTSLGAVLDEIPGGGTRAGDTFGGASFAGGSLAGGSLAGGSMGGATSTGTSAGYAASASAAPSRVITPPTYVEAKDALSPALGGMALMTFLFALFGLLALAGGVTGTRPDLIAKVSEYSFIVILAIGIVLSILGLLGGLIIGKVRA